MASAEKLPQAIICDLDGTLCNIYHRQHYVLSKPKNWKAFYEALGDDLVHEFCQDIIMMYKNKGYAILLVSGRPDNYKQVTKKWLSDRGINYDLLLMRKDGDFRKDYIVKQELYERFIKYKYNIFFVLDDRDQVVRMWRKQGLTCLQVAEGKF